MNLACLVKRSSAALLILRKNGSTVYYSPQLMEKPLPTGFRVNGGSNRYAEICTFYNQNGGYLSTVFCAYIDKIQVFAWNYCPR
jgi:hypothetical protein